MRQLSRAFVEQKIFPSTPNVRSLKDKLVTKILTTAFQKVKSNAVTPKMIGKVIMNLDLSKASGPDYIPVVVLKNCEPELSYILAELFNKCLMESCFPD